MKVFIVFVAIFALAASEMSEEERIERTQGKEDSRCPTNDDIVVHLAHSKNCGMFYKCYNQRAYLMDCPAGMWWYQEKQYCDMRSGECQLSGEEFVEEAPEVPEDLPEPVDPKPEHPQLPEIILPEEAHPEIEEPVRPQVPEFIIPKPEHPVQPEIPESELPDAARSMDGCPAVDDPKNPTHLAHPFECDKFFLCAGGEGYLFNCPAGLHWSIEMNRCEHPAVARCQA